MNVSNQKLWAFLQPVLAHFAKRIVVVNPALRFDLRNTISDAFPLRAYVSFMTHGDGDELAVMVDVNSADGFFCVASDICFDDGRVLASGPSLKVGKDEKQEKFDQAFRKWLIKFEKFLREREGTVLECAATLA